MGNVLVNGTDTSTMGLKEILAGMDVSAIKLSFPSLASWPPVHTDCLVGVQHIDGLRGFSKVINTVVTTVLVDMVKNLSRLLSVMEKPSDTMGWIVEPLVTNSLVAVTEGKTNAPIFNSSDFTGVRAVSEVFSKGCRYDTRSHVECPLSVVSGAEGCSLLSCDYTSSLWVQG